MVHCEFMVQHNIPLNVADHLSKLYAHMFQDSPTAKAFTCARTKTTSIINLARARLLRTETTNRMRDNPFALINDGSSDSNVDKMNATCVYLFDVNR